MMHTVRCCDLVMQRYEKGSVHIFPPNTGIRILSVVLLQNKNAQSSAVPSWEFSV